MFMTNKAWKVFVFFSCYGTFSGRRNSWRIELEFVKPVSVMYWLSLVSDERPHRPKRLHISRFPSTCVAPLQRWTFHPFHCWMGSAVSSPPGVTTQSPLWREEDVTANSSRQLSDQVEVPSSLCLFAAQRSGLCALKSLPVAALKFICSVRPLRKQNLSTFPLFFFMVRVPRYGKLQFGTVFFFGTKWIFCSDSRVSSSWVNMTCGVIW